MAEIRKQTGTRGATQGQYTKPGYFYPSPSDPVNDYGLIERKTVDSKDTPIAYGTAHPDDALLKLCMQKYEAQEDGMKSRTRLYRTLPGEAVSKYVYDDEIGEYITVTTQDVAIGTANPTDTMILQCQDSSPTESGWITRTTMTLAAMPAARTEYRTEQFTFPALLASVSGEVKTFGQGNVQTGADTTDYRTGINSAYVVTPSLRPAITAPTKHKIVTSYFRLADDGHFYNSAGTDVGTDPATILDTVYTIAPNIIRASGRLVDFSYGEVLNNGFTINAEAGANDFELLGLEEEYIFGASTPNYTAYAAAIGTDQIVASDFQHWRGRIYTKRSVSIKLR